MAMVSKRCNIPRTVEYTKAFMKSWQRYNRSGRHNMNNVVDIMQLIFANKPVPSEYLDHELKGNWMGTRELHVGGDFLLLYNIDEKQNAVVFVDMGTHSELFG